MFQYKIKIEEVEHYIKIYEDIVSRMRDKEKQKKLYSIYEKVKQRFQEYIEKYYCLENMVQDRECKTLEEELNECYKKRSKEITIKLEEVIKRQEKRIQALCPLCEIDNHHDKEHYLPKSEFPEYSIFMPNITPVCSMCNSKKGNNFLDEKSERQFFNIYFDKLPKQRIMKAEIVFFNGIPIASFHLLEEMEKDLSIKEISVIKNHFKNLDLLKRYERAASDVICERINLIRSEALYIDKETIKKIHLEVLETNIKDYGINYWKNVLDIAIFQELFDEFYTFCTMP